MEIYVGNATTQNFEIQYRIPETTQLRRQPVPYGGQVKLLSPPGGFNQAQVDSIVEQLSPFGMIPVEEVNRSLKTYNGLCYSIDKVIKSDKIEQLLMHNTDTLVVFGKKMREEAAVGENGVLLKQAQEGQLGLRKSEISIQEEDGDGSSQLSEGFVMEHKSGGGRRRR